MLETEEDSNIMLTSKQTIQKTPKTFHKCACLLCECQARGIQRWAL